MEESNRNLKYKILSVFIVFLVITVIVCYITFKEDEKVNKNPKKIDLSSSNVIKKSCGIREGFVPTIFGGHKTSKGDWPWNVAFIDREYENFFCGGTLISARHVLSGEVIIIVST